MKNLNLIDVLHQVGHSGAITGHSIIIFNSQERDYTLEDYLEYVNNNHSPDKELLVAFSHGIIPLGVFKILRWQINKEANLYSITGWIYIKNVSCYVSLKQMDLEIESFRFKAESLSQKEYYEKKYSRIVEKIIKKAD